MGKKVLLSEAYGAEILHVFAKTSCCTSHGILRWHCLTSGTSSAWYLGEREHEYLKSRFQAWLKQGDTPRLQVPSTSRVKYILCQTCGCALYSGKHIRTSRRLDRSAREDSSTASVRSQGERLVTGSGALSILMAGRAAARADNLRKGDGGRLASTVPV